MRSLHVAALAFPSTQGTQGLVHSMLEALALAGHDTHLACYAHGATRRFSAPYTLHRLQHDLGQRSLRAGPSWGKLALDALLVAHVRALVRRLRPDLVVAHHVEAALACVLSGVPYVFVAHTSLRHELGSYFPRALAASMARAGAQLDRALCARAQQVLAVAPGLAELLHAEGAIHAAALPIPWRVPAVMDAAERQRARVELGFVAGERVLLYAGNLDAYQGLPVVAEAVSRLGSGWRWLVATESDLGTCRELASSRLPIQVAPLASERDRRLAHAAADVVVVPRASPGGLPMKLLDALSRGARVVATQRACAGLALTDVCQLVPDDDPAALARACAAYAAQPTPVSCEAPRAYVRTAHAPERFVRELVSWARKLSAAPPQELF
jgi:glycosyltransferase involved in cell wall biosynthesis